MYDTLMNLSLRVVDSHEPNKQQKEIDLIGNVVAVPGWHDGSNETQLSKCRPGPFSKARNKSLAEKNS